jgi:hypothetical protein
MFHAFADELVKIAGFGDLWQKLVSLLRPEDRAQKKVEYHFSPTVGDEKWGKFIRNVRDLRFVDQLAKHPDADNKLVMHAQSMHDLARAPTVNKIKSTHLPGRTYEIKKLPNNTLGCTCPDWRFKGSVNPGYECKHIKAHGGGRILVE